ncbi:palmitoyl-CoA hydrolase TDEL_0E04960 [Torulaspora delbrueckii]|uniref:Acyl-CoA thioesterase II n=1 Tax=Torulaspora delbrueckii TaxID=4950 RepID=G8ZVU5_TORDE|nr:hypothetical protein TDEL_0E04960 [Torulaspora delbrueckii]CCE92739.1 hypothetical protein TDEL_0E04960 [Torulaspora delbrueckii]
MSSKSTSLEKILELTRVSATRFVTTALPAAPVGSRGTFGGTLVAQSLLASLHTVPVDFVPTSLHCYFVSGGDPSRKIFYEVQDLRHGKNFIHKHVRAYQSKRLVFTSAILYAREKKDHDSLHFLKTIKSSELPKPEKFKDAAELFKSQVVENGNLERYGHLQAGFKEPSYAERFISSFHHSPIEYRFPQDMFYSHHPTDLLEKYARIRDPVTVKKTHDHDPSRTITPENDHRYNYVAFAYLSDSYFLLTVPYFHQLPMYSHKFSVSLDHCIHFHQLPRVNDWIYLQVRNPRSYWDKHVLQGEYFNGQSGEIIASVSQEGLVVYDSEEEIKAKF